MERTLEPFRQLIGAMTLGPVEVSEERGIDGVIQVTVKAEDKDVGILVGKGGKRFGAMVCLMRVAGAELRDYVRIRGTEHEWKPSGHWPDAEMLGLMNRLLAVVLPGAIARSELAGNSVTYRIRYTGYVPVPYPADVRKHLCTLFEAIGKKHGWSVGVVFDRYEREESGHQPSVADGRWAKEVDHGR